MSDFERLRYGVSLAQNLEREDLDKENLEREREGLERERERDGIAGERPTKEL